MSTDFDYTTERGYDPTADARHESFVPPTPRRPSSSFAVQARARFDEVLAILEKAAAVAAAEREGGAR